MTANVCGAQDVPGPPAEQGGSSIFAKRSPILIRRLSLCFFFFKVFILLYHGTLSDLYTLPFELKISLLIVSAIVASVFFFASFSWFDAGEKLNMLQGLEKNKELKHCPKSVLETPNQFHQRLQHVRKIANATQSRGYFTLNFLNDIIADTVSSIAIVTLSVQLNPDLPANFMLVHWPIIFSFSLVIAMLWARMSHHFRQEEIKNNQMLANFIVAQEPNLTDHPNNIDNCLEQVIRPDIKHKLAECAAAGIALIVFLAAQILLQHPTLTQWSAILQPHWLSFVAAFATALVIHQLVIDQRVNLLINRIGIVVFISPTIILLTQNALFQIVGLRGDEFLSTPWNLGLIAFAILVGYLASASFNKIQQEQYDLYQVSQSLIALNQVPYLLKNPAPTPSHALKRLTPRRPSPSETTSRPISQLDITSITSPANS